MEISTFSLGHGQVTISTRRDRTVEIRHITARDDGLLVDLFHRLSSETRRLRFHRTTNNLPESIIWREAHSLSDLNPLLQAALIGVVNEQGQEHAIGVARLARDPDDPTTAEVALVIRDDYQHEGLGTVLFDLLIQVAMVRGLKCLRAVALEENHGIKRLVHNTGLPVTSKTMRGETTMLIALSDS